MRAFSTVTVSHLLQEDHGSVEARSRRQLADHLAVVHIRERAQARDPADEDTRAGRTEVDTAVEGHRAAHSSTRTSSEQGTEQMAGRTGRQGSLDCE